MHEYRPGHPMYRARPVQLSDEQRQALIAAIADQLRATLGENHRQVGAFMTQSSGLNDERLITVANANGVDTSGFKGKK